MIAEATVDAAGVTAGRRKWPTLAVLCIAELLGMAVWFSASAVVPALTTAWTLDEGGRAWLTMSVQIGFVVGAFGSSLINLSDRLPARWLFTISALLAAGATALIPLTAKGLEIALPLRFLTGMLLAGVYPVGMKIIATWTKADRGLGIGLLVGAVTLGSAMPHLVRAFGSIENWQNVLLISAGLAALGGVLAAGFVDEGPYKTAAPKFNWKYVVEVARDRDMVLANLGYLGHMWELYAMWSWIPVFLLSSFELRGVSPMWAALAAFATIGVGGVGSVIAGKLADRVGRTTITIVAMAVSGLCALLVGRLFGGNPVIIVVVCLVWGLTVVADSAQFSACISELSNPLYIGTALAMQTSLGFLLTLVTIRLLPTLAANIGWEWAFAPLAIGPVIGVIAMAMLRRSAGSVKLAGGRG